jgi:asparaginyl-tRNA synthetase
MTGPYRTETKNGQPTIRFIGNKRFPSINNVCQIEFETFNSNNTIADLSGSDIWPHIHKIDSGVFSATVSYFQQIKADWCSLPLTTMMISSPGEVYAGQLLDYTTDALPVQLTWFDVSRPIFLSESSQFYLELALLTKGVDKVFAIYNSFRKEKADFTRLSEFNHIEFEGHVDYHTNIDIALDLLEHVTNYLLTHNSRDLQALLTTEDMLELEYTFNRKNLEHIAYREALDLLYKDTGDAKYKEFSLKHFGAWEEVKLTEIVGRHIVVREMPLMELPFYHNAFGRNEDGSLVAQNADIILCGYRETIGCGTRIVDPTALEEKCRIFNLPLEDYAPYLESRRTPNYQSSSGFGMGWQRYTQWLLKLPFIWSVCRWPRGHTLPKP